MRQHVQECGFPASCSSADENIILSPYQPLKKLCCLRRNGSDSKQTLHGYRFIRKTPDRNDRPVKRYRIHDNIYPRTIGKSGIYNGGSLVYHTVAARHNLLNHILKLFRRFETHVKLSQPSLLFHKDMILSVDHDFRNRSVLHKYLQDIQPAQRMKQLFFQIPSDGYRIYRQTFCA